MPSITPPPDTPIHEDDYSDYRSISASAVISLILGGLSILMLFAGQSGLEASLMMAPIPALGIITAIRALVSIRRMPNELAGKKLAMAGLFLSAALLIAGIGRGAIIHVTEVPPGYHRLTFDDLRTTSLQEERGIAVPPEVLQLNNQKVFIKGYMRPSSARTSLPSFLFVRDNKTCCFGAITDIKYYDQIRVEMMKPMTVDYMDGVIRLGGRLHVYPENAPGGPGRPVFAMIADYVK
ncbi:MAG: DUF4190 domain-containing protein [Pirellulales bacterium]|nr:DUF4190 domain-containing protein [Pirellulales bacterium]